MLTEEIRFRFFLESGLNHAGARAANGVRVGQRAIECVARSILMHGEQAGNAALGLVLPPDQITRPLGRDHCYVDILGRRDLAVMNVETVREKQHGSLFQIGSDLVHVNRGLSHIGRKHHDHVRAFGSLGWRSEFPAILLRLGPGRSAAAQPHYDVELAIAQV